MYFQKDCPTYPFEYFSSFFIEKKSVPKENGFHGTCVDLSVSLFNSFSAGTAFMLMQTGWIQASRRVTRRLA